MGFFSFIKDAGEKLFGGKDAHAAAPDSGAGAKRSGVVIVAGV